MTIPDGDLLSWLKLPGSPFVTDPGLAAVVEVDYESVALHQSTTDPNRVTIHVPTEKTVLSLGAASDRWKTDIGITGYTDNHVHFETKAHDRTIVSLGGPATTAAIHGHDEKVPGKSEGYSMVTDERAWHESSGQHYLLSQEQDISMLTLGAGKRAVVQADQGFLDVNGGEEVNLCGGAVAIGAASEFTIEKVPYDGNFGGKSPTSASAKTAKIVADVIGAVFSAHDLGLKAFKTGKKQWDGKLKKNEFFFADVVKWGTDAYKFKLSVDKLLDIYHHVSAPEGCVKIAAEKDVVGLGGTGVTLSGALGASLASTGVTAVSAGMTASMKGTVFAGVGGILTSLRGQKKIEISSTWGDVVFSAKKNVELTSNKELILGSKGTAQVTGKQLVMGAGKQAFIGAETGWGAVFDAAGVAFGKADGVDNLKSASIPATPAVRIASDHIKLTRDPVSLKLSDDSCVVEAPGIRLECKRKNATFNGKRAKLD
jgi:hypothetical protein